MNTNRRDTNSLFAWGRQIFVARSKIFLVLLFLFFLLFPAQAFSGNQSDFDVFVSVPPQKWLGEQLGDGRIKVHLLVEKGQDPHGFEPAPRKIQALAGARLFFTAGLEFEQELVRRLQTGAPHLRIVDSSRTIQKIQMQGVVHAHGERLDPHVWLSPPNLKSMAAVMATAFIENDPGHEHLYEKNLELVNGLLDDLDQEITKILFPYRGASFFVFHPAFGYFAKRYQLQQVAVETGGKSPTPKQLFRLIRKARAEGVRVVFVQPQFDPGSAEKVATAINGKVVPLDPLAEDAAQNLENMAVKIAQAFEKRKGL